MPESRRAFRIGIISDTHAFVEPSLPDVFRGVDHILHAGDVGKQQVLDALAVIAPVTAVKGNVDLSGDLVHLPERVDIELGGTRVQLVHRIVDACAGPRPCVVVSGHSHQAGWRWQENILYVNPGAAGRQGFHRLRTVCLLTIGLTLECTIVSLGPKSAGVAARSRRER
jgi:uncharacterized protein